MTTEFMMYADWKYQYKLTQNTAHSILTQLSCRKSNIKIPDVNFCNVVVAGTILSNCHNTQNLDEGTNFSQIMLAIKPKNDDKKKKNRKRKTKKLVSVHYPINNNPMSRKKNVDKPSDWLSTHHNDEYQYALGLFDPKSKKCVRIPNPLPIATATASQRGILTVTANATGYFSALLTPYGTTIFAYNNGVGYNESTSVLASSIGAVTNIMASTNAAKFRVVSAWLGVSDLTSVLSKTGTISFGMIPYSQAITSANADTIRDSMWTKIENQSTLTSYVGGFFMPMDPSGMNFTTINVPPTDYMVPIAFISGAAPSANISVEYFINYEYTPTVGQTDLLSVQFGPVGSQEQSLINAGKINAMGGGFAASAGKFGAWALSKLPSIVGTGRMIGAIASKVAPITKYALMNA